MHVSIESLAERENAVQTEEDALLLRTPAAVVVPGDGDRGCVVGGHR